MQIFVKTASGATVAVRASAESSVAQLLAAANVEAGSLFFAGARLEEAATLAACGLTAESTVDVVVPVEGGKGKKKKKRTFTKPKKPNHQHKLEKMRALRYFKVTENDDGSYKVEHTRQECPHPQCGAGIFMAQHKDRKYCGKCHLTYKEESKSNNSQVASQPTCESTAMGLSDIDEDDGPTATPPHAAPSTAATAQHRPVVLAGAPSPTTNTTTSTGTAVKKGFDLDDLFGGGMGTPVSGNNNNHSDNKATSGGASLPVSAPAMSSATAAAAPRNDVLDSLFAAPAAASPGSSSSATTHNIIHVDDSSMRAPDDGTDLFDTSRPAEKQTYSTADSLLEAFARQGKKGGAHARFGTKDSLEHLTKNKDDNKVRARLLALMDFYDVLGVAQNAPQEEIKRNYKRKALELHPDRVGRDQTPEEAELFKTITKAHEVLTDPEKKAEYDRQLRSGAVGGIGGMGGTSSNDGADWLHCWQQPTS